MEKLKVIQFGMRHEHADGKIRTLKKMSDTIELVGVVNDADVRTPFFRWNAPFMTSAQGDPAYIKNNCLAVLEYPGCYVKLHTCSRGHGNVEHRRWMFAGSDGIIEVYPPERFDGKGVKVNLSLRNSREGYPAGEHVFLFLPQSDRYMMQLKELESIVRGEMSSPYTCSHDLEVHEVTLAASGYFPFRTG